LATKPADAVDHLACEQAQSRQLFFASGIFGGKDGLYDQSTLPAESSKLGQTSVLRD